MKIKYVIFLLLLLCLVYSQLSAESYWNLSLKEHASDSVDIRTIEHRKDDKAYENDLVLGYFIALGPGFFVHGAGNIYAGNGTRGLILMGVEALSIMGIFAYGMAQWGASERGEDVGAGVYIMGFTSFCLFFSSWVWDIATVGGEIQKRHPAGVRVEFGALPSIDGNGSDPAFGVNLGIRF